MHFEGAVTDHILHTHEKKKNKQREQPSSKHAYRVIVVHSSDSDNGGTNRRLVTHRAVEQVWSSEVWSVVAHNSDDHCGRGCPRGCAAVAGCYIQLQENIALGEEQNKRQYIPHNK